VRETQEKRLSGISILNCMSDETEYPSGGKKLRRERKGGCAGCWEIFESHSRVVLTSRTREGKIKDGHEREEKH